MALEEKKCIKCHPPLKKISFPPNWPWISFDLLLIIKL